MFGLGYVGKVGYVGKLVSEFGQNVRA